MKISINDNNINKNSINKSSINNIFFKIKILIIKKSVSPFRNLLINQKKRVTNNEIDKLITILYNMNTIILLKNIQFVLKN